MTDVQENETASDELIAELLAGLDGVTPGPWLNGGLGLGVYTDLNDSGIYEGYVADADSHQDIAHIARCSPENIRKLIARIALPTADGAQQVAGWKLVPVETTKEMRQAGADWANYDDIDDPDMSGVDLFVAQRVYTAMLAAAPSPPAHPAAPGPAGEDPHLAIHIYDGDSVLVIRDNGNKTLHGVKLPELLALIGDGPAGEAGDLPVAWRWFDRASENYDYIDNERGDYDAYQGQYNKADFTPLVPASRLAAYQAKVGDLEEKANDVAAAWARDAEFEELEAKVGELERVIEAYRASGAPVATRIEALLPGIEPAYWIVTWPGKSQGVHAAYGDIEEAKHAAKNIANYSTRKTETTIVPLYTVPASDLWKDRYESLLADAQQMEASIGARDE